ncbi:tetratricopeptide repeat protein [Tunicatimonas pelagia]|uniref:tetratricopeptide repeat protein n=1 Tax=Tunicatimonas pelagia TaxID=931531 RepID=UPI0026655B2E|nr:tetratricopeptide repeat protein [Tunicatimonas pelagia]WKN45743.1 tetratricopeptide repeat protein [Tunicatimonas pelagia]
MRMILTITVLSIATSLGWAQRSLSINNPEVERLIKQNIQHLYNTDVAKSKQLNRRIRTLLPNHPVNPLLEALTVRAAHHPIEPESQAMEQLKKHLYQTVEAAEVLLEQDEDDPEATFFTMAGYGLLSLYENETGNYMKAVSRAKEAYGSLKAGMDMKEEFVEFYFSTGLYNYYREKYPEIHPIYKPFTWFFKSGDKALGLEQIKKSHRESTFMRAEAADYLTHIYLHYENDAQQGLKYARILTDRYPDNPYFTTNFVDAALTVGTYQGLDASIRRLLQHDRSYYRMGGHVFQGMLLEKRDQDFAGAERQYIKSLEVGTALKSDESEHYRSCAYAGLARIAHQRQKYAQARKLYEKALASAQYEIVEKEAKAYLN